MSYEEKVTVITPTFERLNSLKEAIDSVIKQTYHNWEYFIVSDGYDSKVRKYIKSLNDRRIKYLFTLHTGYVGHLQRNVALKFAKGKYVFCLDDDNIIYKDYIEKMVGNFTCDKIGYVVCYIKYDGKGILKPSLPVKFIHIDMLNYMVKTNLARVARGWFPFDSYEADFHFIHRISKISEGKIVPEILGYHRDLKDIDKHNRTIQKKRSSFLKQLLVKVRGILHIEYDIKSTKTHFNRFIYKVLWKMKII